MDYMWFIFNVDTLNTYRGTMFYNLIKCQSVVFINVHVYCMKIETIKEKIK